MDIYIIIWLVIAVIISMWTIQRFPPRNILSQYSYKELLIGIIFPSTLLNADVDRKDIEATQAFVFRFRLWNLYILGSLILLALYSSYTASRQLDELHGLVEQVTNGNNITIALTLTRKPCRFLGGNSNFSLPER